MLKIKESLTVKLVGDESDIDVFVKFLPANNIEVVATSRLIYDYPTNSFHIFLHVQPQPQGEKKQ